MSESEVEITREAVSEVQDFDPNSVVRSEELGQHAFQSAVEPIRKLVELYSKLTLTSFEEIPNQQLNQIRSAANASLSLMEEAARFDTDGGDNRNRQQQIVDKIEKNYDQSWNILYQYIAYGAARTIDFTRIENQGRSALKEVERSRTALEKELREALEGAQAVLADVRKVAAEQGVTQQAIYFKTQAETHKTAAKKWLTASIAVAVALGLYAVGTLFLTSVPGVDVATRAGLIQLTTSKIVIFLVLTGAFLAVVRNYQAHKHNQTVNEHRQNALLTYRNLAEAGGAPETREVILSHAAAAIYSPVESGYVRNEDRSYGAVPPSFSLLSRPGGSAAE